jgi:pimeloyl-ACP methyl ester carboxylesterase
MRNQTWSKFICVAVVSLLLGGCALFGRAPLHFLTYPGLEEPLDEKRLIVFMRGLGGSHESFEKEGLVDDIRDRNMPYDMAAPNAHFGYYLGRTLIDRMKADLIDPAKAEGYEEIWLIGFSMGGLGSLLYLREHPDDIQGVYLIAPFLSLGFIQNEIIKAGGLRQWDPGEYDPEDDWQRALWHWLKDEVADNPEMNIYISYGTEDTYVKGQQLLAEVLPPDRVTALTGGHNYETFRTLWQALLDSGVYISGIPEASAQRPVDSVSR